MMQELAQQSFATEKASESERAIVERLLSEHRARAAAEQEHAAVIAKLPSRVSPATARVLQATRDRIHDIDDEFGLLEASEVAELLGSRGEPRHYAADLRRHGRVLSIKRLNRYVYPAFQFDAEAERIKPVIGALIALAAEFDRDPQNLPFWLCRPTSYLAGDRPVDHLDEPERVLDAARSAWGVQW